MKISYIKRRTKPCCCGLSMTYSVKKISGKVLLRRLNRSKPTLLSASCWETPHPTTTTAIVENIRLVPPHSPLKHPDFLWFDFRILTQDPPPPPSHIHPFPFNHSNHFRHPKMAQNNNKKNLFSYRKIPSALYRKQVTWWKKVISFERSLRSTNTTTSFAQGLQVNTADVMLRNAADSDITE